MRFPCLFAMVFWAAFSVAYAAETDTGATAGPPVPAGGDTGAVFTREFADILERMDAADYTVRDGASDDLLDLGVAILPQIRTALDGKEISPEVRFRLRRARSRIKYRMSKELAQKVAGLMDAFDECPPERRSRIVEQLRLAGGKDALPALRYIFTHDASLMVKKAAAYALSALGDPTGKAMIGEFEKFMFEMKDPGFMKIFNRGIETLHRKEYAEGIAVFGGLYEKYPRNRLVLYNLACAYSLNGEKEKAVEFLQKAVVAGFVDFKWIEKDPDLEGIRKMPEYIEIVNRLNEEYGDE